MGFEETLHEASLEYLERAAESPMPIATVDDIFNGAFYTVEVQGGPESPQIVLPGPGLWKLSTGFEGPHFFQDDRDDVMADDMEAYQRQLARRRERWPDWTLSDGLIYLNFRKGGRGRDLRGVNYVEIKFINALPLPNNRCDDASRYRVPRGYREREKLRLTDVQWVETQGHTGDSYMNESDHGRVRYIYTEGFSRFQRRAREGEDGERVPETIISTDTLHPKIWSVTPQVLPRGSPLRVEYSGAPLGEGSLTAFLKHMEYEEQMDRLVR